jgi:exonuclease VII large subunit
MVFVPWLMVLQFFVVAVAFYVGRKLIDKIEWKKVKTGGTKIPEIKIDSHIYLVTTESKSLGAHDFIRVLKINEIQIHKTVRMKKFLREDALVKAIDEIFNELRAGDVVAIIRGGGDITNPQFDPYRSASSCACIRKLRNEKNVIVVVGIAHSGNTFPIDEDADISADTPTYAAFIIAYSIHSRVKV